MENVGKVFEGLGEKFDKKDLTPNIGGKSKLKRDLTPNFNKVDYTPNFVTKIKENLSNENYKIVEGYLED